MSIRPSTFSSVQLDYLKHLYNFDESDSKMIEVDASTFYVDHNAKAIKDISIQYQMKATKQTQVEHLTHVISVRKTNCHCLKCR